MRKSTHVVNFEVTKTRERAYEKEDGTHFKNGFLFVKRMEIKGKHNSF